MQPRAPILPLADAVIDQIAAGEVIERPSSIVKELLENSLDAGADLIVIEIEDGGIERILVRDNGCGIPRDELVPAVLRHHTSKLVSAAQLPTLDSLGFRGEALASIAAVAEFRITSRTAADPHGWSLSISPGKPPAPPAPLAHPQGTTIEVRSLFAAVPARRQFLKRPRTEFLHIQQLVRRAGFCYADVALRFVADGRQNLVLAGTGEGSAPERRWRSLFGVEFAEHSRVVDALIDGVHVTGRVGSIGFSRQNSDLQFIAVNRRIVRDRNIAHAVRMAYENDIDEGRHIAYALHVAVPPEGVDVNVHPGKAEVRFREPRTVHDSVFGAVRAALRALPDAPEAVREASVLPVYAVTETRTQRQSQFRVPPRTGGPHATALASELFAIVDNRFAFVAAADEVAVIDLHAAIQHVVAARLRRGERDPRPLIIPEAVAGDMTDAVLTALGGFGVEFGRIGEHRLLLRAVPIVVNDIEPEIFASSLQNALDGHIDLSEAIGAAAAAAFRAPAALGERRKWYASLEHRLHELDIDRDSLAVTFDSSMLNRLLAAPQL